MCFGGVCLLGNFKGVDQRTVILMLLPRVCTYSMWRQASELFQKPARDGGCPLDLPCPPTAEPPGTKHPGTFSLSSERVCAGGRVFGRLPARGLYRLLPIPQQHHQCGVAVLHGQQGSAVAIASSGTVITNRSCSGRNGGGGSAYPIDFAGWGIEPWGPLLGVACDLCRGRAGHTAPSGANFRIVDTTCIRRDLSIGNPSTVACGPHALGATLQLRCVLQHDCRALFVEPST